MRRTGLVVLAVCLIGLTPTSPQVPPTIITTVAGGGPQLVPLSQALFYPEGLFHDAAGRLNIVSDSRVFYVDASGLVRVAAGSGTRYFGGDGGPALEAGIDYMIGAAGDAAGNLYLADGNNHRVRKVDVLTGLISTVAGTGVQTHSVDGEGGDPIDDLGDGGPAADASLSYSTGVAIAPSGDLIIVDITNHRVRKVDAVTGIITTIAGTGDEGSGGDGGPATSAQLAYPTFANFGPGGALFIADTANSRIRRIDPVSGFITTVAGNGTPTGDLDGEGGDPADDLGDGGPATEATLKYPWGVEVDPQGNLFIADTEGNRVRRVDAVTGTITTLAGTGQATGFIDGEGGDPADDYTDNVAATTTTLNNPTDLALDAAGGVLIADASNFRVRRVDPVTDLITGLSGRGLGDGVPATSAVISPQDVVIDAAGDMYIAGNGLLRRVDAGTGIITTLAGCSEDLSLCNPEEGRPPTDTLIGGDMALAIDTAGDLFIADQSGNRVWKYLPASDTIHRFAGTGLSGSTGDGGPALDAAIESPAALATDAGGNLYIAQSPTFFRFFDARVRRVDAATGNISTVFEVPAGSGRLAIEGLALDAAGNLFMAEPSPPRVRRVDAVTGAVSIVAGNGLFGYGGDGGPATDATLAFPRGLAVDSGNGLLIADSANSRVRRVDLATGIIETVAGNGDYGFSGEGGPPTSARLADPVGVATLADGGFLIADGGAARIRQVAAAVVSPPVADAGADQTLQCTQAAGTPVTLDGSGSGGGLGSVLTFTWSGPFAEGGGAAGGITPIVTLPMGPSSVTLVVAAGSLVSAPDDVAILVTTGVSGLRRPMAGLVPEGQTPQMPTKQFRRGGSVPLKLGLHCGANPLGDQQVAAPQVVGLRRQAVAVPISTLAFNHSGKGEWDASLPTTGLQAGQYEVVIGTPDGRRWVAGFVLK